MSAWPFALAAAGGVLHFLGYVGFGVWPLALVSLACLWGALEATRTRGLLVGASAGFAFGWTAHAGGYTWLWRLVEVFLGGNLALGATLWLAHSVWFALGFALHAALYQSARRRGWGVAAAGLSALLSVEWLYPTLFPVHLGDAFVDLTVLIQIADLGGPLLPSGLAALGNAAALETWRWAGAGGAPPRTTWLAAGLALLLAGGYGVWRIGRVTRALEEAPSLRLGLVQANLGALEKRSDAALAHRRHLEQTRELLAGGGELDLVVWPETVYSGGILLPLPVSGDPIRGELRIPLLFGAATIEPRAGRRVVHNSALLVGTDGSIRSAYAKNLLVPFAEQAPLAGVLPGLAGRFPHAQRFAPGTDVQPLVLGPWRISTPICSESAEPGLVRRMVARGDPHLIVTLSNDAWFGDSQEPWIHLQVSRLRAVEHHRTLVHATNSGISAVVDPLGRVLVQSGLLTRENLRADVHMLDGQTLYGRLGDWPGALAVVMLLLTLGALRPGNRIRP